MKSVGRSGPLVLSLVVLSLALGGCQDMSPRDYYIFGQPSTSQPATQAPQPVARPAPQAVTLPVPSPEAVPETPAEAETRPVVALLLPLSGSSAAAGKALLEAATVAAFDVGDDSFIDRKSTRLNSSH